MLPLVRRFNIKPNVNDSALENAIISLNPFVPICDSMIILIQVFPSFQKEGKQIFRPWLNVLYKKQNFSYINKNSENIVVC